MATPKNYSTNPHCNKHAWEINSNNKFRVLVNMRYQFDTGGSDAARHSELGFGNFVGRLDRHGGLCQRLGLSTQYVFLNLSCGRLDLV